MPKIFMAKGGTVFAWHPDDPNADIEATVPASRVTVPSGMAQFSDFLYGENPNAVTHIPRADLDEFIAHIVSQAAEETLGRVLLFPCLQPPPPKSAA
jgi:hypothetical protein